MASASGSKEIPLATVAESLENAIAGLDRLRTRALAELARVHVVKRASSDRERTRLEAKLGPEHPRVVALKHRAEVEDAFVTALAIEGARASVTPPTVDERSWALHGHVLDARGQPVRSATVALYTGERWVEALGYACTDESGYFRLHAANATVTDLLYLRVRVSGATVHQEEEPVTVRANTVEYRQIVIREGEAVCLPPEGGSGRNPPEAPRSTEKPASRTEPGARPAKGTRSS